MDNNLEDYIFKNNLNGITFRTKEGQIIPIEEFISFPEEKIFDMLGLTAQALSQCSEEERVWYIIIILVIRSLKAKGKDNENT